MGILKVEVFQFEMSCFRAFFCLSGGLLCCVFKKKKSPFLSGLKIEMGRSPVEGRGGSYGLGILRWLRSVGVANRALNE